MKFSPSTIAITAAAIAAMSSSTTNVSAFTAPTKHRSVVVPSFSSSPQSTRRFLSDNTANNFMEDMEKNAQEKLPEFLFVDVNAARTQLAKNWGGITASGLFTMALGLGALSFPIFASGVAYDATTLTVGATGVVGLINAFQRENGHKTKSAISGILYLGLAYLLATNPGAGLDVITLTMAATIGAEGVFETLLAAKNKDLNGRPWHFVGGIGSVVASVWLAANIPVSSLFAPGVALGTRLTSNGATKVAVGLEGKKIADKQ